MAGVELKLLCPVLAVRLTPRDTDLTESEKRSVRSSMILGQTYKLMGNDVVKVFKTIEQEKIKVALMQKNDKREPSCHHHHLRERFH